MPNLSQVSRQANAERLRAIILRVRELSVDPAVPISELAARVKDICVREGVFFDNDIFNELVC